MDCFIKGAMFYNLIFLGACHIIIFKNDNVKSVNNYIYKYDWVMMMQNALGGRFVRIIIY